MMAFSVNFLNIPVWV